MRRTLRSESTTPYSPPSIRCTPPHPVRDRAIRRVVRVPRHHEVTHHREAARLEVRCQVGEKSGGHLDLLDGVGVVRGDDLVLPPDEVPDFLGAGGVPAGLRDVRPGLVYKLIELRCGARELVGGARLVLGADRAPGPSGQRVGRDLKGLGRLVAGGPGEAVGGPERARAPERRDIWQPLAEWNQGHLLSPLQGVAPETRETRGPGCLARREAAFQPSSARAYFDSHSATLSSAPMNGAASANAPKR